MLKPFAFHRKESIISTRATIHFFAEGDDQPESIVYRHADGDPGSLGQDLIRFFDDLAANLDDTRFCDPTLLAARWVVFDAAEYQSIINGCQPDQPPALTHRCDFLSVRVLLCDPPDIAFRYLVRCRGTYGKGTRPRITCQKVQCSGPNEVWSVLKETTIRRKRKASGETQSNKEIV